MPAATLRKPDYTENPPTDGSSRVDRLQNFVQQDLVGSRGARVSLIAWCPNTKRWVAWFDRPVAPAPNAKPDALAEADVAIAE